MSQSLLIFTIFSVIHLLALIMSMVLMFEKKEFLKKFFWALSVFFFSIVISIDMYVLLKSLK